MEPDYSDLTPAAQGWLDFTRRLGEAGLRIHKFVEGSLTTTPQQNGEVNELLMFLLASGALMFPRIDPDHPEWFPLFNSAMRPFNPNQDTVYCLTRIRGSGTYRVTGKRGTAKIFYIQIHQGMLGFPGQHKILSDVNIDDCKIAADGSYELILGPERPTGYEGAWVQLDREIDNIFLSARSVCEDWIEEEDPTLTIQRLDKDLGQQHWTPKQYLERLNGIADYIQLFPESFLTFVKRQHALIPINGMIEVTNLLPTYADQSYGHGIVEIRDDEAWILETDLVNPGAYWGIQIMDAIGNTLDFMNRQCGLNSRQGAVDSDGRLRIVITRHDPGVLNWIDKADYDRVTVRCRFFDSAFPKIQAKVVPVASLWDHLPADTRRVSRQERQKALRERSQGAQLRRRW